MFLKDIRTCEEPSLDHPSSEVPSSEVPSSEEVDKYESETLATTDESADKVEEQSEHNNETADRRKLSYGREEGESDEQGN
jgi:hypothetical protein